MRKRKSLSELKSLILPDIEYCKSTIESLKDDKNPQVKEIVARNEIRLDALEDVLRYITNGEKYGFMK